MAGSSHYAGVLADLPCFVESYVDPSASEPLRGAHVKAFWEADGGVLECYLPKHSKDNPKHAIHLCLRAELKLWRGKD